MSPLYKENKNGLDAYLRRLERIRNPKKDNSTERNKPFQIKLVSGEGTEARQIISAHVPRVEDGTAELVLVATFIQSKMTKASFCDDESVTKVQRFCFN